MFDLDVRLRSGRPLVMGILNLTPDSFSDGGEFLDPDKAVEHAIRMAEEGAELIDLGAESTRPGSVPVDPKVQLERLLPVLDALGQSTLQDKVALSVDTSSHVVAEAALKKGCAMINDVTAGSGDPDLLGVVARSSAWIVLMHMQGTPDTMQRAPHYEEVVSEVSDTLLSSVERAVCAGVRRDRIVLDPGIGFGKSRTHNLQLIRRLHQLVRLGYPILLGCSRKRFMGALCRENDPKALLGATVATTAYGYGVGARIFRVHDVRPNRQALDVMVALEETGTLSPSEQESDLPSA